jgi:hypothetical protein
MVGLLVTLVVAGGLLFSDSTSQVVDPDAASTTSTSTSGSERDTTTTGVPTSTSAITTRASGSALAVVDTLVVAAADDDPEYRRAAFGDDWNYDPITGCNTRERVLIEESLVPPVVDDRCRSSSGRWLSAYDGVTTTDPAVLQIDHFVPLADAWRSGADAWTPERRLAFANDLDSPETLIAVTGQTNQSKSDSTPDQWLPPERTAWCAYATSWVDVKATWDLTVTPPEKVTLVQILSGC